MKAIRVKDRVGSGTSSYSILRAALPPLVALAAALWHGPFVIDDAYITFRYAENLASGAGLVFNPGEPVLGTTSPLMAMLLALFHLAGEEIPLAALELGIASGMLIVFIAQRLAARFVGPWEAAAVGICLALHPDLTLVANSGMETGLSMCAVYGTLLMTLRRKYLFAGLLGGVAFLLRPDGALVVALAAGHALLHAPRRAWQPLVAAGVVAAPWLIYATATYGGVVPHSIAAKQLIHADAALHILVRNFQRLVYGPVMEVLCLLAVVGHATEQPGDGRFRQRGIGCRCVDDRHLGFQSHAQGDVRAGTIDGADDCEHIVVILEGDHFVCSPAPQSLVDSLDELERDPFVSTGPVGLFNRQLYSSEHLRARRFTVEPDLRGPEKANSYCPRRRGEFVPQARSPKRSDFLEKPKVGFIEVAVG